MVAGTMGRTRIVAAAIATATLLAVWLRPADRNASLSASIVVTHGPIRVRLIESGVLRPRRAVTYRSPLEGRETEVTFLAPEGLHVQAGDLIARLDTSLLERELERTQQALAQARLELQVADDELAGLQAVARAAESGEDSLDVEEAAVALTLAERQSARATREVEELTPLLARGYITSDELERAQLEAEQREAAVRLAARRLAALRGEVQPQGRQKAVLQAAQQASRRTLAADRVRDLESLTAQLREGIGRCALYADAGGLVVYEENLSASPRRRVRVGDRVTPSQGLVTIPEIDHMVVETSVRETDVQQVIAGLPVVVHLDAFPDERFEGNVELVSTLARGALDRPYDDKRYDVRVALTTSTLPLRPDMTARVEFKVAERNEATLLPVTAVVDRGGQPVAYVTSPGGVEVRSLRLGLFDGTHFEVLSGVTAGERVLPADNRERTGRASGR
jgi:HlyD family secretion protein